MITWLTSDCHFDHENVIKYAGRPFGSVHTMNDALIRNWNERVQPDDIVYHLGDFTLGGVDVHNFYPISVQQAVTIMDEKAKEV